MPLPKFRTKIPFSTFPNRSDFDVGNKFPEKTDFVEIVESVSVFRAFRLISKGKLQYFQRFTFNYGKIFEFVGFFLCF